MNMLHIHDAKDEDELVEDKVPELVFDVLKEIHKKNQSARGSSTKNSAQNRHLLL